MGANASAPETDRPQMARRNHPFNCVILTDQVPSERVLQKVPLQNLFSFFLNVEGNMAYLRRSFFIFILKKFDCVKMHITFAIFTIFKS